MPRLFLSLNHLSAGSLTDVSIVRRLRAPVSLRAGVEPFAAVVGQRPLSSRRSATAASRATGAA